MKRDMDLIRAILMQVESGESSDLIKNTDGDTLAYHAALMKDAGLIEATIIKNGSGSPAGAAIIRLTWDGHDFLDAARNDSVWNGVKSKVIVPGLSWSFSILMDVLKIEAQRRIQAALGIPPAP